MALGAALKEARMRRKLTASEVAGGTRMKVQVVTALEEEDFSSIAAPIYAKGFIRLYAEFVGLDPHELINEYVARFVEDTPAAEPEAAPRETPPAPAPEPVDEPAAETVVDELPLSDAAPEPQPELPVDRAPRPALVVSGPDDDAELDLFTEVEPASNDRRGILMDDGYREAAPPLQARVGHTLAGAVDGLQQVADAIASACRRACGGVVGFIVATWKRLVDTVMARRRELTQIDFKNLSARHMMALLGVLVLVLLVISSLSRCVRRTGDGELPGASQLPVAAEPEDVYLD